MKEKFKMTVYVAVWCKGATEEFEGEPQAPRVFEPMQSVELHNPILYYDKKEEREIYVSPVAVFGSKEEAQAWLDDFDSNTTSFEIRKARLSVF